MTEFFSLSSPISFLPLIERPVLSLADVQRQEVHVHTEQSAMRSGLNISSLTHFLEKHFHNLRNLSV